ncbi:CDP-glycerol glycerophosphotransferase family protein [Natronorubrum sp. DTA28]|uniref:CDP-glycerol glycerophosphotransferase family protein n=1 Tax=Natronorubrum sp. DTA28 TaxID=3447019 RepID=UPI003F82A54D
MFPVYLLSFLAPRNRKLWIYGYRQGTSFTDNSKHLYLHTSQNEDDIRSVFMAKDQGLVEELRSAGYEAYTFSSFKGIYLVMRSGNIFITHSRKDVPWWCTGGATIIRLGHGIPFKKFGWAHTNETNKWGLIEFLARKHIFMGHDYSIATSKEYRNLVAEATDLSEDKVWITGLPRMDMFGEVTDNTELWTDREFLNWLEEEDFNTVFLYFPTWRSKTGAGPFPNKNTLMSIDKQLMEDELLIVRNHPSSEKLDDNQYENIVSAPSNKDFYPILKHIDIMITDYSSLFYDALYEEIPIIFYPHDFSRYMENREFYFKYNSVPGKIVEEDTRLLKGIEVIKEKVGENRTPQENRWMSRTFDYNDYNNCSRVVEKIRAEGLC